MVIINMLFNSRNLTYVTRQDGSNIGDKVFRSTLTVVFADNLASQLIGGYKVLNLAFRKCRYCMATDEQIKARLAHLYYMYSKFCIMFMITAPEFTKTSHIATTYGLNRESSLNKLAHFHTTEGLIPDVMHDVLEGVLPLAIKYFLKHLLALTSFTVVELNRRMERFDYGVIEASNRPRGNLTTSQLNGGDRLKQSGEHCTLNKH